jgi:anti-sigma-K factor RskA
MLNDGAKAEQVTFELFLRIWHEADQFDPSRQEIKTGLLQKAYVIAKAGLPPSAAVAEHWENLTDIELDEILLSQPAPAELLEGLKAKVMATIEPAGGGSAPAGTAQSKAPKSDYLSNERQAAKKPERGRSLWPILAFGFGIAASVLAVYSSFIAHKLSGQLQESTIEFVALRQELKITQAKLGFALSPQTEVLTLTGQSSAPEARAKLVWDPADGQGILIASGLAPAPADKSYQLWVIAGGKPVAVKVFEVDSSGTAEVRIAHLPPSEHIFAFNVTLEPAGGVAEPTGEKLLSGSRQ